MNLNLIPAAIITLCFWTILYKENRIYRLAEHIFIGTTMGYAIVVNVRNFNVTAVAQIMKGNYIYIVAVILGLLMYSAYFPRNYRWANRIPLAVTVGTSIGISLRAIPEVSIFRQITATVQPILRSLTAQATIENIILITTCLFTSIYFTYTLIGTKTGKTSGFTNITMELGKNVVMLMFGIQFGNSIIQRISMLVSRMQFLVFDLLGW